MEVGKGIGKEKGSKQELMYWAFFSRRSSGGGGRRLGVTLESLVPYQSKAREEARTPRLSLCPRPPRAAYNPQWPRSCVAATRILRIGHCLNGAGFPGKDLPWRPPGLPSYKATSKLSDTKSFQRGAPAPSADLTFPLAGQCTRALGRTSMACSCWSPLKEGQRRGERERAYSMC